MSISETEINEKKHKARAKAAAWAVHSFTTSGIVLGFLVDCLVGFGGDLRGSGGYLGGYLNQKVGFSIYLVSLGKKVGYV